MTEPVSILVVDDEPALCRLMQIFLERTGYAVDAFGDARSALEAVEAAPGKYRLLVADLSLPDMPGQEMALRILELSPGIGVLLCSGYPFELETLPPAKRAHFGCLQKPFVPKMLADAVAGLLTR